MKLQVLSLMFLGCLATSAVGFGQEKQSGHSDAIGEEKKENKMDVFETHTFEADGKVLNYRFLKPEEVDAEREYPLVIFLHGAGERGDDNKAQLVHGAKDFLRPENRTQHACYAIFPQCPKNQAWASIDRTHDKPEISPEPSEALSLVFGLVEQVQKEFKIDKSRIYITGLSMGGYGTFDAIERHPELFAAAIPVCGGGDSSQKQVAKIKSLPIWIFHGGADNVVPAERSREMVAALKEAGANPKYTEYPGVGHDSWTATYKNPEVFKWLFEQVKK